MSSHQVRNNMERTVEATIAGFEVIDYPSLAATRTDDFVYQFLPLSLGAPPRNMDEYREFFLNVFSMAFQEFKVCSVVSPFCAND